MAKRKRLVQERRRKGKRGFLLGTLVGVAGGVAGGTALLKRSAAALEQRRAARHPARNADDRAKQEAALALPPPLLDQSFALSHVCLCRSPR